MKPIVDEPGFADAIPDELSMSQRVSAARAALADALAREDWEAVAELDVECRACVEAVLNEPGVDRVQVRKDLEGLLELYRSLVADVSEVRQRSPRRCLTIGSRQARRRCTACFPGGGADGEGFMLPSATGLT